MIRYSILIYFYLLPEKHQNNCKQNSKIINSSKNGNNI